MIHEACPTCSAPIDVPNGASRIKCPYCSTSLAVQRNGSEVALTLASALTASIEKSGTQTQEAIREGSYVTQTELRRLQIAQDLSMAQMRLSNVQSEIRSIERLPVSPVTRKQLAELRATEANLKHQVEALSITLNPPSPATPAIASSKSPTSNKWGARLAWLLFSINGRASRRDYWLGIAINFAVLIIMVAVTPTTTDPATGEPVSDPNFISTLLMLLFLWIGFAISAKRYHDRGKAAWWVLIILIPLIGFIWQIFELALLPGDPGPNQYS
jgi:LSD1 subclass zinc finger protein